MNISQPEPEDPALTPVHAPNRARRSPQGGSSSDAPLAERFLREFAAQRRPRTPTATRRPLRGPQKVLFFAPPKQLRSWAASHAAAWPRTMDLGH